MSFITKSVFKIPGHSKGRKRHLLSGYDSDTHLPAHRHRYGLAQLHALGQLRKTALKGVTTLRGMALA